MKLKIAANCIRGNKRRSNEDMVLVGESFLRDGSIDFSLDNPDLFFALVSDGMGGHDHGEMASEFLLGGFVRKFSLVLTLELLFRAGFVLSMPKWSAFRVKCR